MDQGNLEALKNMVRIGKVSSINASQNTVRVIFPDLNNMVSGNLRLVQRMGGSVRIGSAGAQPHSHEASLGAWLPEIGEMVLCLYLPVEDGDGFVLGGI